MNPATGTWVGRERVMRLLRSCRAGGRRPAPVRIDRLDESIFVVSPVDPSGRDDAEPASVATRITVADGRVVAKQQYRSRDDAVTAAASR